MNPADNGKISRYHLYFPVGYFSEMPTVPKTVIPEGSWQADIGDPTVYFDLSPGRILEMLKNKGDWVITRRGRDEREIYYRNENGELRSAEYSLLSTLNLKPDQQKTQNVGKTKLAPDEKETPAAASKGAGDDTVAGLSAARAGTEPTAEAEAGAGSDNGKVRVNPADDGLFDDYDLFD